MFSSFFTIHLPQISSGIFSNLLFYLSIFLFYLLLFFSLFDCFLTAILLLLVYCYYFVKFYLFLLCLLLSLTLSLLYQFIRFTTDFLFLTIYNYLSIILFVSFTPPLRYFFVNPFHLLLLRLFYSMTLSNTNSNLLGELLQIDS